MDENINQTKDDKNVSFPQEVTLLIEQGKENIQHMESLIKIVEDHTESIDIMSQVISKHSTVIENLTNAVLNNTYKIEHIEKKFETFVPREDPQEVVAGIDTLIKLAKKHEINGLV
ncbi:MAG: hypothetical protein V1848_00520 [Candidatus Magasanikbacteria bacterium]